MRNTGERRYAGVAGAMLVAVQLGCAGSQAGGQTGDEDALPPKGPVLFPLPPRPSAQASSACGQGKPTVALSSLDDERAGFSPRAVLSYAEQGFRPAITWHTRDPRWDGDSLRRFEPSGIADRPEPLAFDITYDDGALRYVDPGECGYLEIEVAIRLRSDSGALDESVTGVMRAFVPGQAKLSLRLRSPGVEIQAPPGSTADGPPPPAVSVLAGALQVRAPVEYPQEDPELGDPDRPEADTLTAAESDQKETPLGELALLDLQLNLSALGANGWIDGFVYRLEGDRLLARGAGNLATIGELCERGGLRLVSQGFVVASDDRPLADGTFPSAQQIVDRLDDTRAEATYDDGTQAPLALEFRLSDENACARPGQPTRPLEFGATLVLDTPFGAGHITGSWPVRLTALASEDGELDRVGVALQGDISKDNLADTWGVRGIAVSDFDAISLELELHVDATTEPPAARGQLSLRGLTRSQDGTPNVRGTGELLGHMRFE